MLRASSPRRPSFFFRGLRLKGAIERSRLEIARLRAPAGDGAGGFRRGRDPHRGRHFGPTPHAFGARAGELNATRRSTKAGDRARVRTRIADVFNRDGKRLAERLSCLERRALLDRLEVDAASFDVAGWSTRRATATSRPVYNGFGRCATLRRCGEEAAEAARARDSLDAGALVARSCGSDASS